MAAADCVVIVTDHKVFDYDEIVLASKLVIDTRNATKIRAEHVVRLGAPLAVGQPATI
jgi:UDP-N-acetyl-D-glucosamine dehydrogenase